MYKPKTETAPKKQHARLPETPPGALTLDDLLGGGRLDTPAGRTRACRPPGSGGSQAAAGSLQAAEEAAREAASTAAAAAARGLAETEQAARAAALAGATAAPPTAADKAQVCSPAAQLPRQLPPHALSPRIRRPPRCARPGWALARTGGMIGSMHLSRRSGAPAEWRSSNTSKS